MDCVSAELYPGPAVVAVRGPSRSGKTFVAEFLISALQHEGISVAYVKRTHHELDLPSKASGRVWSQGPSAMVLRAPDRLQLTLPAGDGETSSLVAAIPADIDVVLLETHRSEPFPTVLSALLEPEPDERVIGRWSPDEPPGTELIETVRALLPPDRTLDRALRAAVALHGGRGCPGVVLGTRLAVAGMRALSFAPGERNKSLIVRLETGRCVADAVEAVTNCRLGKGTLQFKNYGKVGATFFDTTTERAVRVAARGDLRSRASEAPDRFDRRAAQRAAYLLMPDDELFVIAGVAFDLAPRDLPGAPRERVLCERCGEEVSDGREIVTELGTHCRPCAAAVEELEATLDG